jgi:hypothetical protein
MTNKNDQLNYITAKNITYSAINMKRLKCPPIDAQIVELSSHLTSPYAKIAGVPWLVQIARARLALAMDTAQSAI